MIRFLHAADLHLGLRITRFDERACARIGEARFEALEHVRDKANEHQVDFVIIAGDVFDDHSVSRTVSERAFALFEGKTLSCPVYIIPGNHDPLTPGGVWDREPWSRDQPTKHVHLLREAKPTYIPGLPVVLFPCPLRNRNSADDPTEWIARDRASSDDVSIRIGVAHGSLNVLPNLPLDDHLIRPDAVERFKLDYLALGHWHKPKRFAAGDRIERTAYSGTHEPMRFPGSDAADSIGWLDYSQDGASDRFQDEGRGTALLVSIDEPGAPPQIQTIEVGRLRWAAEHQDLTGQGVGAVISAYAGRDDRDRTLMRLKLTGILDPELHARLGEIENIISNRYYPGSCALTDDVLVEPTAQQLEVLVGDGVLARMLERLRDEASVGDSQAKRVANHALKLLYRIAWEERGG
jgi:DNA repair exonuclease SbcCD nuclease subunit